MDNLCKVLLSLFLILPSVLKGEVINYQKAITIAREFISATHEKNTLSRATSFEPILAYESLKDKNSIPYFYIFNIENGGYVIISGNDSLENILGYSFTGSFDINNVPDNMKGWLTQYEQEIDYFYKLNQSSTPSIAISDERTPINPLLKTQWDQGFPYNKFCPIAPDNSDPCITGCVATAMAQIMNHHKWPLVGKGEHSYTLWGQDLSIDFNTINFDWDNMLSTYTSDNYRIPEQQDAVATLMKCCGYSVNMIYGPWLSLSYDNNVIAALFKYFDYDADMKLLSRRHFYSEQWEDIVYNELSHNRPIYYRGSGNGGHAFVCDGYDTDGFFHFNWGWNGYCDGYFKLSALYPSGIGSGGSTGGYNYSQAIITGIKKRQNSYPQDIMLLGKIMDIGGGVTIYYDNPHAVDIEATYGLKAINESTGEIEYLQGKNFKINAGDYGAESFDISDVYLTNGRYKVFPMFRPIGQQEWIEFNLDPTCQKYAYLEINDEDKMFYDPLNGDYPEIKISSLSFNDVIYEYSSPKIDLQLSNSSNFDNVNDVSFHITSRNGTEKVHSSQINIEVLAHETRRITKTIELPLSKGEYEIQFTDIRGKAISDKVPFTVHSKDDIIIIDNLWCIIESEIDKTIKIVKHPEVNYSGDIYIPEHLSYNGVEYTVTEVERDCFSGCKELTSICMDFSGWTEINDWEFEGLKNLHKVVLSDGIREIGNYAFLGCNELEFVYLPESVIKIGYNAFAETNLKDIIIPENVVFIGCWAFGACNKIESLKLGENVEIIEYSAFQNAEKLTDITLPASLKNLGRDAFMLSNLKEIISLNSEPPITGLGDETGYSFNNYTHENCILKVPQGSLDRYKNAYEWSLFKNISEINTSGISNVTDKKGLPFKVSGNEIQMIDVDNDAVSIYNHLGQLIYTGNNRVVKVNSGIYFIAFGKNSYKVLIK